MMQQHQQTSPPMAPNPTMYPHPSTGPSVRRLYYRHQWFKLGFGGLVLSAVLFFVGFLAPGWSGSSGLWMWCYGNGNCYDNVGHGPGWFDATRSMEVLALVCFLGSVGMELYQDVFKSPPPRENKAVEILGVIAGVLGLIGVIIYGAKTQKYYSDLDYAFGLATAGLALCIPSSVLMWVSREKHAMLTYHSLVSLGVQVEMPPPASHPAGHPAYPMHSFAPPPPPGYPYPVPGYPYPYPYASPYPYHYPAVPTMMAPGLVGPGSSTAGQGMTAITPVTSAQGMPTSQVPTCFVAVQGQMLPVYGEMPLTNTATTANMTSAPADERPVQ